MTDSTNLVRIIQHVQKTGGYNLIAIRPVNVSFDEPLYTVNAEGIGTLESFTFIGFDKKKQKYILNQVPFI